MNLYTLWSIISFIIGVCIIDKNRDSKYIYNTIMIIIGYTFALIVPTILLFFIK